MSEDIRAIFDNGVFRPLEPLEIPDGTFVSVHVESDTHDNTTTSTSAHVELSKQQTALQAMFQAVDRLPQIPRNDNLSGRNHDKILYGVQK